MIAHWLEGEQPLGLGGDAQPVDVEDQQAEAGPQGARLAWAQAGGMRLVVWLDAAQRVLDVLEAGGRQTGKQDGAGRLAGQHGHQQPGSGGLEASAVLYG